MLELNIDFDADSGKYLYEQIYEYIRDEIRSGRLKKDEKIPSTRALAEFLHISRSTASLAYDQLLSEGYIYSKRNSGYYISGIEDLYDFSGESYRKDRSRNEIQNENNASGQNAGRAVRKDNDHKDHVIKAQKDYDIKAQNMIDQKSHGITNEAAGRSRIDLAKGLIDFSPRRIDMSIFPYATWKKISREILVDARSGLFSLGDPIGDEPLRTTIAHYLHTARGVNCRADQVVIGAGNDYLLMLLRLILGEDRWIGMENPTYLRAARIFHSFGYEVMPLEMDEAGMRVEQLERCGCSLAYVMPSHQFPTGTVMPITRRLELLRWAAGGPDRYLIEDDYDSEFRYRGKPIPSLQASDQDGKVIYIGTFSKSIAPAIRISYMILPPALMERFRRHFGFFSSTVSRIDQGILNEFMSRGYFERYLNKTRKLYKGRHDHLLRELRKLQDRFTIHGEGAGLHVILMLRESEYVRFCKKYGNSRDPDSEEVRACEQRLRETALENGVLVYPESDNLLERVLPQQTAGEKAFSHEPSIMLGYGALNKEQITRGVDILDHCWRTI